MDPCFVNFGHTLDRPGQLSLQRLQQLDTVLKFGGAEFAFIKNFEPFVAAWQSLPGQL